MVKIVTLFIILVFFLCGCNRNNNQNQNQDEQTPNPVSPLPFPLQPIIVRTNDPILHEPDNGRELSVASGDEITVGLGETNDGKKWQVMLLDPSVLQLADESKKDYGDGKVTRVFRFKVDAGVSVVMMGHRNPNTADAPDRTFHFTVSVVRPAVASTTRPFVLTEADDKMYLVEPPGTLIEIALKEAPDFSKWTVLNGPSNLKLMDESKKVVSESDETRVFRFKTSTGVAVLIFLLKDNNGNTFKSVSYIINDH